MLGASPYLHFMGNSLQAMNFYRSVFGGEFATFTRYKDVHGGEKMSPDDQEKIIHISLPIAKDQFIMASDMLESMERDLISGNNFHILLQAENETEVDKLFTALSNGGKIEVPLNKTFWGAYFGMCADKFGIDRKSVV